MYITCFHKYIREVNVCSFSGTTVRLASRENEVVTIEGIDEYGYLRVKCANGQELSLQPDGNSFDIMKGLIVLNFMQTI